MARARKQDMLIEFIHPELGEDVQGRAGYYIPIEEHTLTHNGREVIYILGYARLERPCCGDGANWGYIQVPGYLVRRQIRGKGNTQSVSKVEIIQNENDRNNIRQSLQQQHPGAQIEIWGTEYLQSPQDHAQNKPSPQNTVQVD